MKLSKRQREIIDVALGLIAQSGIQGLTIKNIASELGISEPAIYRHFKNKAEIVKTMIADFEAQSDTALKEGVRGGMEGVEDFVKSRIVLVAGNPPLAKVMFSEELFLDDPEYSEMMRTMMHRHKASLEELFKEAVKKGEVRKDVELEMLFRLVLGPVRLLIKQWGMSNYKFNLVKKGDQLWESLRKVLG